VCPTAGRSLQRDARRPYEPRWSLRIAVRRTAAEIFRSFDAIDLTLRSLPLPENSMGRRTQRSTYARGDRPRAPSCAVECVSQGSPYDNTYLTRPRTMPLHLCAHGRVLTVCYSAGRPPAETCTTVTVSVAPGHSTLCAALDPRQSASRPPAKSNALRTMGNAYPFTDSARRPAHEPTDTCTTLPRPADRKTR
jgi:hypothetical protein